MTADPGAGNAVPAIRKLGENLVYGNKFAAVYDDPVAFADGSEGSHLRIVESGGKCGAVVLAVCGDRVALVHVYRYPLGAWEWAVPRGFSEDDDPVITARRELSEELGQEPDDLISIGEVTPNSGLLAGHVNIYLARYGSAVSEPSDLKEVAEVKWLALRELYGAIARGDISDGFTLSALMLAQVRGLIDLA